VTEIESRTHRAEHLKRRVQRQSIAWGHASERRRTWRRSRRPRYRYRKQQ